MSSTKVKWSNGVENSAQVAFKKRIVLLVFFILLLGLLASCNSYATTPITATSTLTPSPTATITYTPTPSPTPTKTLTPTLTPTPIGGGENYIFAYVSYPPSDKSWQYDLVIVLPDQTLKVPLGSIYTSFIAISPIGDVVVYEVQAETSTDFIAVYVHESPITPVVLTSLPEDVFASNIIFSPDGKWLFVKYRDFYGKEYQKFIEMETGRILINYDCKKLAAFALNNVAYCQDGYYADDYGKLDLSQNIMDKSFLELPNSKMFFATQKNWHARIILPSLNAFIMKRDDGSLVLANQLESRGKQTFWDVDQIDDLIASPVIAVLPKNAHPFQYLLSPDGKKIAITGENKNIPWEPFFRVDPRTFTFVTPINQTYYPQNDTAIGSSFHALSWSPDSKALLGLCNEGVDGTRLSIWDAATMTELEVLLDAVSNRTSDVTYEEYQDIWHRDGNIQGIAAIWLP